MNNHIMCIYMKSFGMDPIKVNVLVDKDSPWSPLMGWGMKHQRARNGQFDKRWQPVEKTKDYQLLEGAWGQQDRKKLSRYRNAMKWWPANPFSEALGLFIAQACKTFNWPPSLEHFSKVGRYWQILWGEIFFFNIFQRWKILADIVRRRQSTPLSWGLVCKPQDWNATQLLLWQ